MFLSALKEFFFPQDCPFCGKKNFDNSSICKNCYSLIRWFDTSFRCKRCLNSVDIDELYCIRCKKGFFYPEKLWIAVSHPDFFLPYQKKHLYPLYLDFLTLFLIEKVELPALDAIAAIQTDPYECDLVQELSKRLLIPYAKKNSVIQSILLVAFEPIAEHVLNEKTLFWIKKGVLKVYVIQAVKPSYATVLG